MFRCWLIVNYGVALHHTCYTIVCIVLWCPAVYKSSTASIQSISFTVNGIPFFFSELLISFAGDLWFEMHCQMRERIYSDGMMNKQTWVFNFQYLSLCYSITPFWNFSELHCSKTKTWCQHHTYQHVWPLTRHLPYHSQSALLYFCKKNLFYRTQHVMLQQCETK